MTDLSSLLNIPILQAVGVVFLIALSERVGFPIVSIIKSLLKMNGSPKNEVPPWAISLTEHFNETTTSLLERIAEGVDKLDERGEKQCKKLDDIVGYHQENEKYGVKIRKE